MKNLIIKYLPRNTVLAISSNFVWSLLGLIASKGSVLLAAIFVARFIGKSDFGLLGFTQSTIVMFSTFAMFGISTTVIKYVAEYSSSDSKRNSRIIRQFGLLVFTTGFTFSLALFFFSSLIAKNVFNAPEATIYLQICSVIPFIDAILGYISSVFYGFRAFKRLAQINFFVGIISFISLVSLSYLYKLNGVILALVLNCFLSLLIHLYFFKSELIRNNISWYIEFPFKEIKIFLNFTIPAFLSSIMITTAYWVSNYFLVNLTNSFDEVAIFNAANQWRMFIVFIPATLGSVILPLLAKQNSLENTGHYGKTFNVALFITIIISVLIAIPLIFFSSWIMQNYGSGFKEGFIVLNVIAVSGVLMCINNIIGMAIVAKGLLWLGFFLNFFWAMFLIVFSYFFITVGYGALGIALATLVSYFLHTILQVFFIKKLRLNH